MPDLSAAAPPVAVCIPARNEQERLPTLLRSLQCQRDVEGPIRVVVVANNCTDGTVALLRDMARDLSALRLRVVDVHFDPARAHVGSARRRALDEAAAWLVGEGHPDGVLLSTDADAMAPPTWVAANLRALAHADVIGGRLVADEGGDPASATARLDETIERYWAGIRALEDVLDPAPHDPSPRHGDHTAASLALPVSLYRRAGGLPPLPCREDVALVERLRCLGARVRHCPEVSIVVSARREGRVAGGMATEMDRRALLVARGEPYLVPSAAHWHEVIWRRAALRTAWRQWSGSAPPRRWFAVTAAGLDAADLDSIDPGACPNDIAFVERATLRTPPAEAPRQTVEAANAAIAALLRELG